MKRGEKMVLWLIFPIVSWLLSHIVEKGESIDRWKHKLSV